MEIFQELLELKWYRIVILVALILLGIAFYKTAKQGSFLNTKRLSYAAMCLAISFVLSCIKLYRFPQGGSITPGSMLPMVAFALACGPAEGAVVGMALGLLGLIQDPYIVAPLQVLVDYPLASAAIALGGFAAYLPVKKVWKLPIAVVLGTIGRYIMAVISGVVFFGEYAPEGQSALAYSLTYNIGYLGPDMLVCIVLAFIPGISRLVDIIQASSSVKKANA